MSPLQTDLYQLTMAAAHWQAGTADRESVFHLFFRRLPFQGGYAIAAGLEPALEWLERFRFRHEDLDYLASLRTPNGRPLFLDDFLGYLGDLRMELDVDAIPEGSAVFAHEPLLRVQGKILHAQLAETALLNWINFQTLVATKTARICHAAAGSPVFEFGYRRAQGPDGALSASRAAYIGGCEGTYDTLEGVEKAIVTARKLREQGHELSGIRLDSGDLAWLSQQARAKLDAAGFSGAKIVATNDLDEHLIESLRHQDARIDLWGVGTNLVTASDQPALGGVYKLAALRRDDGNWQPRIKLSEQTAKSSVPGRLQVRRFTWNGQFIGDAIYDIDRSFEGATRIVDPSDPIRRKEIPAHAGATELLRPVMKAGRRTAPPEALETIRDRCRENLAALHPGILRLRNPHAYPAGLEEGLHQRREIMLGEMR